MAPSPDATNYSIHELNRGSVPLGPSDGWDYGPIGTPVIHGPTLRADWPRLIGASPVGEAGPLGYETMYPHTVAFYIRELNLGHNTASRFLGNTIPVSDESQYYHNENQYYHNENQYYHNESRYYHNESRYYHNESYHTQHYPMQHNQYPNQLHNPYRDEFRYGYGTGGYSTQSAGPGPLPTPPPSPVPRPISQGVQAALQMVAQRWVEHCELCDEDNVSIISEAEINREKHEAAFYGQRRHSQSATMHMLIFMLQCVYAIKYLVWARKVWLARIMAIGCDVYIAFIRAFYLGH